MTTILVAEDEQDLREAIATSLKAVGYEVIEAANGEEALDKYRTSHPNLVLLDLNMPKMHGLEVLKHIRADEAGKTLPVTILTAQDDIASISDATVIGGFHTDYLPKANRSLKQIIEHIEQYFN